MTGGDMSAEHVASDSLLKTTITMRELIVERGL